MSAGFWFAIVLGLGGAIWILAQLSRPRRHQVRGRGRRGGGWGGDGGSGGDSGSDGGGGCGSGSGCGGGGCGGGGGS